MAKVLLIGCGQLGTAMAISLHQQGFEVVGVRQSSQQLPHHMKTIQADILAPSSLTCLAAEKPDYLIYCISANRRTDEAYAQYYVQGLQNIIDTQQDNDQLKRLFFISSTRVYGQVGDALLDEETLPEPADFGGHRLLEAERLLAQCSYSTTVLRLSGIYSDQRLYLIRMAQNKDKWPTKNGWSNRIHEEDVAGFIAHLLNMATIAPLYIVTDSQPTKQYEVLTWLVDKMQLNMEVLPVPQANAGKRLSNKKLLSTGYTLRYPNYQQGYAAVLAAIQEEGV